jgi:site-specific DNA-cytosine methylase
MKKHFSTFSGDGGFDIVLEETGEIETVAFVEKDPYCQIALSAHWPNVPIYPDITEVSVEEIKKKFGTIDIITGGFPCQDVSVAGNRKGLAGSRSGLWFEFLRLIKGLRPEWLIIENVPGLLSSNEGRDLAVILRGLVECGYGWSYRILDAQYFGVPQRRRRVFIVGHLGDGRSAEVLFEREGLCWDTPPRTSQRKEIARTSEGSSGDGGRPTPSGDSTDRELGLDPLLTGENPFKDGPFWDNTDRADTLDVSSLVKGQMMPEKRRFPVVIQPSEVKLPEVVPPVTARHQGESGKWPPINELGNLIVDGRQEDQFPIVLTNDSRGQTAEDGKALPLTKSDTGTGRQMVVITSEQTPKVSANVAPAITKGSPSGGGHVPVVVYENHAQDSRITESEDVSPTLHSKMGTGGNNVPLVEGFDVRNLAETGDVAQTVQSKKSGGHSLNYMPVVFQADGSGLDVTEDGTTPTVLHGGDGPQAHGAYRKLAVAMDEDRIDRWEEDEDKIRAVQGDGHSSTAQEHVYFKPEAASVNSVEAARPHKLITRSTIRRFTPLETERLQGFPDGWTAVKGNKRRRLAEDEFVYIKNQLERVNGEAFNPEQVTADSHRYRQMGNAVALPPVRWMVKRLVQVWNSPAPELVDLDELIRELGEGQQLRLI